MSAFFNFGDTLVNFLFARKMTKNKLDDNSKLLKPLYIGLNYPLGSCLSADVILLKSISSIGTQNQKKYFNYYYKLGTLICTIMEVIFINNDCIVKAKIDAKLFEAFKTITAKTNETQQSVIENAIKDYVLANLEVIILKGSN